MSDSNKRKAAQEENRDHRAGKRSKGGSGGKWQTPHQRGKASAKSNHGGGGKIELGDAGIWATCIKGKEGAATEELKSLFEEYARNFYGLADPDAATGTEQEAEDDIETSIQKEVDSIGAREGPAGLFTPVYLDLQCVLFFKTRHPIVPVDFVRRICEDASNNKAKRRVRFVKRLTPVTKVARATEKSLEELGKEVLAEHFQLTGEEHDRNIGQKPPSYAIRPTIRNHNTLKRDTVIKLVASLIGSTHRVDLTKSEKVVIVEIYQTICGMSVVDADWENLKRYNLAEIYEQNSKPVADREVMREAKATPGRVSRDESQFVSAKAGDEAQAL